MNVLLRITRPIEGIHAAAYLLAGMTFLSFVTSILRDRLLAHHFGAGDALDVYFAAFRIPDLLFIFLTSFISVFALIPILESKRKESKQVVTDFIDTLFFVFSIAMIVGVTVLFLLTPPIAEFVFSDFTQEQLNLLIPFTRIILLQVIFLGISVFLASLTQFHRRFFIYALTPTVYNVGIIVGIIVFQPTFGILGAVWGVVLGAVLHLGVQLPWLLKAKMQPALRPIQERMKDVLHTIVTSFPRDLALTSNQIALLVIFGTLVGISTGTLSVFWFAERLQFILLVIGISYSIAAFPTWTRYIAEKNYTLFSNSVAESLQNTFLFVLPFSSIFIIFSSEIIQILFETGLFTPQTTRITAIVLIALSFGTLGLTTIAIVARAFYAAQKTLQPFLVFVGSAIAQIIMARLVVDYYALNPKFISTVNLIFGTQTTEEASLVAIAFGLTIIQTITGLLITYLLYRKFKVPLRNITVSFTQHLIATIGFAVVAHAIFTNLPPQNSILTLFFLLTSSIFIGFIVWNIILQLFKNKEWEEKRNTLLKMLQK